MGLFLSFDHQSIADRIYRILLAQTRDHQQAIGNTPLKQALDHLALQGVVEAIPSEGTYGTLPFVHPSAANGAGLDMFRCLPGARSLYAGIATARSQVAYRMGAAQNAQKPHSSRQFHRKARWKAKAKAVAMEQGSPVRRPATNQRQETGHEPGPGDRPRTRGSSAGRQGGRLWTQEMAEGGDANSA